MDSRHPVTGEKFREVGGSFPPWGNLCAIGAP
jgi:hypothetical protein